MIAPICSQLKRFFVYGALLACCSVQASSDNLFNSTNSEVPAGFEILLEEQGTEVDVYFGGRYRGSAFAKYVPGHLRFEEPQSVVGFIGDLKPEYHEEMYRLLSEKMPSNAASICRSRQQTNCGTLEPEVLGIIFDESRFKVDVFIHPDFLSVAALPVEKYIPDSSANGLSITQMLGAVYSRSSAAQDDYNLVGNTALAMGESSLSSFWDISQSQGPRIDTLTFQRERRGRQFLSGVFRTVGNGLSFTSDQKILGLRIASSLNTRADRDLIQSSDIQVFLPLPAQVDILRDGRLLSTSFYDAGNRMIDTQSLPSGAYNIALRMTDEAGQVKFEQRFFVKELSLPPKDEIQYFFEAGAGLNQAIDQAVPVSADVELYRAGLAFRISEGLGLDLAVAHSGTTSLLEAGSIMVGRKMRTQAGAMLSSEGDFGFSFASRMQLGAFTVSVDSRELQRKSVDSEDIRNRFIDQQYDSLNDEQFDLLPNAFSQHNLNLNYSLNNGSISARLAYVATPFAEAQIIRSLMYTKTLFQSARDSFQFDLSLSQNETDTIASVGVRYNFRSKSWSHSIDPEMSYRKRNDVAESQYRASLRSSWRDGETLPGDMRISSYATADDDGSAIGLNGEYSSRLGRGSLEVAHQFSNNEFLQSGTRVALNASTGFVTNLNRFALGGSSMAQSAILVDITGDAKDALFDVYVNNAKVGYVSSDSPGTLQLAPFNQYEISISMKSEKDKFLGYSQVARHATLYPGNVVALEWQANEIIIGYGRASNELGEPIAHARIEGGLGQAYTDENGIFQLEALSNQAHISLSHTGGECSITLPPEATVHNGVRNFGELVCR